jgi:hypothetical protein
VETRRIELQSWLLGEVVLSVLLAASLALLLAFPALRTQYYRPQLLLVLETTMALAGVLVALLAAVRFSVDGLRTDLLLATGFLVGSLSSIAFAIVPVLDGGVLDRADGWAALAGGIAAQGLVAVAPFVGGRSRVRDRALRDAVVAAAIALLATWLLLRAHGSSLPALTSLPGGADAPAGLASALAVQALLDLLAVIGWAAGSRGRETTSPGGSRSASPSSSSRRCTSCSRRHAAPRTSPSGTSCACSPSR